MRGLRINRLCASLSEGGARQAFKRSENAYCLRFGLNREERGALMGRDFVRLIGLGVGFAGDDCVVGLRFCFGAGFVDSRGVAQAEIA